MNVVRLETFSRKGHDARKAELRAILLDLLAGVDDDDLIGLTGAAKRRRGTERIFFAGSYRTDPASGAGTALKLSMRLSQLDDEK